ncbi:hypothetical protein [Saccharothrix syringae]|uniref:Uncharacterized protein n=1 Tax=Saccharothrix syringae TaxID=103733 RepID=A0A5Q0GPR9_SACSY|nr:hypothetical protein [Saccharothrix syringae]QFZ16106.1 hypothetical protein EKG83_00290 [Saccharothrix syringae]
MTDEDLSDLPGPVRAELTRLRAERVVFVAEREKLLAQLREADENGRALLADRDRLAARVAEFEGRVLDADEQEAQDAALRAELASARTERDALRAEVSRTRAERDRLRLRLLDAELALAGATPTPVAAAPTSAAGDNDRVAAAEAQAAHLARELAATRATVSWRVTAPLRAVRRRGRAR